MANVVEVTLRGLDKASSVFESAGQQAEQSMATASAAVDDVSGSVAGVPDLEVSTRDAQAALGAAESAVDEVGGATERTASLADKLRDGFKSAGNFVEENWGKIAAGAGVAGTAAEGFARKQGDTNYALERMGRVTGQGSEEMRTMATDLQNVTFPMEDVTALMETATQRGLNGEGIAEYANFWDKVGDATGEAGPELGKAGVALEMVGITAGNEAEALDAFGYITDNTTGSISDFLRFTERAGKELGDNTPHVNDMAGALAALEGNGYSAQIAQRELQRGLRETDGDMDAAMATLGVSSEEYAKHRDAVEGSGEAIDANAEAYANSLTPIEKLTAWTENLMTKYGGLAKAAGMIAPVLMGLAGGLGAVRIAMQLLGKAGGPVMLIVTALGLLTTGLILAYQKSETFRNVVNAVWDAVKSAFSAAWEFIKPVIDGIGSWFGDVIPPILEGAQSVFASVWSRIKSAFSTAWAFIQPVVSQLASWFAETIPPILARAREIFSSVWDSISSAISSAWEFIKPVFNVLKSWLAKYLVAYFKGLQIAVKVAWELIKVAIQLAWAVIQGIFNTIKFVIQNVLAPVFSWLYENIVKPVFTFIGAIIKATWNGVIKPVFTLLKAFIQNVLGPVFRWLWDTIIQPVMTWIGDKVTTVWNNWIKPAFDALSSFISQGLGPIFKWLWNSIIKPVMTWIGDKVRSVWNGFLKPAFTAIKDFIESPLGTTFRSLWDNVVKPVWGWIGDKISDVWTGFIKPTFDKLGDGLDKVKGWFETGVDSMGNAWDKLKSLTKTPANFVIKTVWNNGIRKLWNTVATKFGASKLDKVAELASGGSVFGPGTSTSDSIPALLSNDEHVWSAREVSGMGGHKKVEELRAMARANKAPAFAKGGAVNWIKEKAGNAWDATKSGISSAGSWVADKAKQAGEFIKSPISWLKNAANKLVDGMAGPSDFGKMIGKVPAKLISDGAAKIKEMVGFGQGGGGGSAGGLGGKLLSGGWMRPNRGRVTSRYGARPGLAGVTGSAFHNGIDLAGGGWNLASRDGRVTKAGWNILPTNSGVGALVSHGGGWDSYYGHMVPGSLKVSAGQMVKQGQKLGREGASGNVTGRHLHFGIRRNGRFVNPSVTGLFDEGGQLERGLNVLDNQRGEVEAVLNRGQWSSMSRLAAYAEDRMAQDRTADHGGPTVTHVTNNNQITVTVDVSQLDDIKDVKDFVDMLKHDAKVERAHDRGTARSGKVDA